MDQSKFINTYVDIIIGQLHEMLSNNLQLKTQIKIANDIIQDKDQLISQLQSQLKVIQNNDEDVRKAKDQAKHWEDSYHSMANKVAHMETLMNQLKDMKNAVIEKDKIILELNQKIEDLRTPKKVINTKAKKFAIKQPIEITTTDDF
jgi:chromosome segregation ATPase